MIVLCTFRWQYNFYIFVPNILKLNINCFEKLESRNYKYFPWYIYLNNKKCKMQFVNLNQTIVKLANCHRKDFEFSTWSFVIMELFFACQSVIIKILPRCDIEIISSIIIWQYLLKCKIFCWYTQRFFQEKNCI